jgi:hypothetical protein
VIESQQREHGRVEVMDVHPVFRRVVTELIGCAVRKARLDAATGHEKRVAVGVVVAAVAAFRYGRASELARPDDQRIFQESAGFEVFQQAGDGLVNFGRIFVVLLEEIRVLIPLVTVSALNKADIGLGQTARQ